MKRYKTGYYIKEGVSSIFTHSFMSFASVCIIIACLLIMGSFSLVAINVNAMIGELESENILLAYVHESLSETEARALESAIVSVPNVSYAAFITREEAMQRYIGSFENPTRFEGIGPETFRHRFHVFVEDVSQTSYTQLALSKIPGIDQINANLEIARGLVTARNIASGVSIVLVAILLIISLFIMSNTIRLATFERREEIAIMKMVGATNSFIRWPFIFEGFILGLFGALVAYVAQWSLYMLVASRIISPERESFISIIPFSNAAIPMFIIFMAIGFGVGVGGSTMAIRRYLKV